ncbi:DUF934 domain-containing protein [Paeniroseomonas aquatica]|uniref:DUF934 domain-containing protein n=1 Tax=Paeniroseomonas aquatica TaxID=373043 RepID=A0ABT8AD31_9PROT|nr:DUF934 domain-containing protein [Paeniroseomonas aquatica]MDN3567254.1 DUF934 domain-containing protein [Paeniroseomonas aquatica]
MPLLEDGRLRPDPWASVDDDVPLPDGPVILGLEQLRREAPALARRNAPIGLALPPETAPAEVAPLLGLLSLVALRLPKAKDGRAFTQARALREYHGFTGEIRATGHVIPDHYAMLLRCGVSTVEVPEGADPAVWDACRRVVDIGYQAALSADAPLSLLRRRLRVA